MMLILKLPIVYLGVVWYWAIKAEPKPPEAARLAPAPAGPWPPRPRHRPRSGPHGGPVRREARAGPRAGRPVSAARASSGPAEAVAGIIAAPALAAARSRSSTGRCGSRRALIVALIAVAMGGRHARLAASRSQS